MKIILNNSESFDVVEAREFVQYEGMESEKDLIYSLVFTILNPTLSLEEFVEKFSEKNLQSFNLDTGKLVKSFSDYRVRNLENILGSNNNALKVVLEKKQWYNKEWGI